ncbi:MAG: hypothetical protein ACPGVU_05720 [Limisphaerales bacterium]
MDDPKPLRWLLVIITTFNFVMTNVCAQEATADIDLDGMTDAELKALLEDPLAEELAAMLFKEEERKIPKWSPVITLELGGGIKDNVALSPVRPEKSPLYRTLFDFIMVRDDSDDIEGLLYASWEDFRFTDSEVDKEQTGLLMGEYKKRYESGWDLGLTAQYIYQSQVLDLSTDQSIPFALNVQGHTYLGGLTARRYLTGRYWVDLRLEANRQDFAGPIDDYWDYSPRLELAKWWGKNHVALSYQFNDRPYDNRAEPDAIGGSIPGTELEFNVHRWQLEWKQNWGSNRVWRTTTRLRRELHFDNGSGFFKYRRWRVGEQIRYRKGDWTLRGQFDWSTYNYPNQTALAGLPLRRRRNDWTFKLRIDRQFNKHCTGYVSYDHEISDSNQFASSYRATVVHAGVVLESGGSPGSILKGIFR